jgi:hypothetical protein
MLFRSKIIYQINPFKTRVRLSIYVFIYLVPKLQKKETLRVHCEHWSVNGVWDSFRCLLLKKYKSHMYNVWQKYIS